MRWVVAEAVRNLASGTTRASRYACLLALVLAALAVAEVTAVDAIVSRAAAYRDSGGSVITLEAAGRVDGAACDALGEVPEVRAAGALRVEPASLVASALPRGPIATYAVTSGLLDVVHTRREATTGVALSRQVVQSLGLTTGSSVVTTSGTTAVHGVYDWPDDGRRSGLGFAALVPMRSTETFDQCWVDAWPVPANLQVAIRTTVLPDPSGSAQVSVSRLNTTLGTTFEGDQLYAQRVTRHAWLAGLLAGALLGLVSVRTRRLELASARHVGARASDQQKQILIESATWVLAAAVLAAAAVVVVVSRSSGGDHRALLTGALHVTAPSLVATLLGAQVAVVSTRERHLFRYFKHR